MRLIIFIPAFAFGRALPPCLRRAAALWLLLALMALPGLRAAAQEAPMGDTPSEDDTTKLGYHPGQKSGLPYELGLQATLIDQNLFKFRSLYQGSNSLLARNENEKTDTYTVFAGVRMTRGLEFFVNPEMARGNGINTGLGLAGFINGDVVRNPALGMDPYLARYFVRYTLSTGQGQEKIEPGENQIEGMRPTHRLVLTAGKIGVPDLFDTNTYANNTRTQFLNWALINNAAYDYAADTRGYTLGAALEWIHPDWAVRIGRFQMPKVANGIDLQENLSRFHGDEVELELHPHLLRKRAPMVVRLLGYANVAHMGNYRDTLALAKRTGTTPDITTTERNDAIKYGFGINFEQPLGDDGDTALFGRYGWNDGAAESFAYTEVDRTFCLGGQLSGKRWRRPGDRLAIAFVQNDLSAAHRDYLAAGGVGFLLGDGTLSYGPERIIETYYSYQVARPLSLALDYQFIANPGYNQDRGPVSVISVRAHLEF
ncbi:MAG TPA: carbohydrate porin [Chthonomonadaceae bacterium]|nr:carbohydrate porin [Chthonomonadaceae bacterium]